MTRLDWNLDQDMLRKGGVSHGVIYISDQALVWNGLMSVEEVVTGGEITSYYFDGVKTLDMMNGEDYSATVHAYVCPEPVEESDVFDFTYQTDREIHLIWNVSSVSDTKNWVTVAGNSTPSEFGWYFFTKPVDIPYAKPTAHLIVNTAEAKPAALAELLVLLYGDDDTNPQLPSAEEVIAIFENYATLVVINHGDGTWTATGPDEIFEFPTSTSFAITWPSVIYIADDEYTISSL